MINVLLGTFGKEDGDADDDGKNNCKYNNCMLEGV